MSETAERCICRGYDPADPASGVCNRRRAGCPHAPRLSTDGPFAAATIRGLEAHNRDLCARLEAQHREIQRLRYALNREWVEGGSEEARAAVDHG
jgi:hypothetical protein